MTDSLIDRIRTRMTELGKNPSGLALEAGLGRSAVRDILSGKVKDPQRSTLLSLSVPLECSVSYLMGEIDTPYSPRGEDRYAGFDAVPAEVRGIVEAGVYRQRREIEHDIFNPPVRPEYGTFERYLAYRDLRLPDAAIRLYEIGDASLSGAGILKGDILSVARDLTDESMPIKSDMLLLCEYSPATIDAIEVSARFASVDGYDVTLSCRPAGFTIPPIRISTFRDPRDPSANLLPDYYWSETDGRVWVAGVVVRITRDMNVVL